MIHGVHIEVVLGRRLCAVAGRRRGGFGIVARHSHRRSEHFRNSGFVYKQKLDVWQCPTGHHLTREQTDFERKIAHVSRTGPQVQCLPLQASIAPIRMMGACWKAVWTPGCNRS